MSLTCSNSDGNVIDLCLGVSGFSYEELKEHAAVFKAGRTHVMVGRLRDLLRMKEIAARPRDEMFLNKYRSMLDEG